MNLQVEEKIKFLSKLFFNVIEIHDLLFIKILDSLKLLLEYTK